MKIKKKTFVYAGIALLLVMIILAGGWLTGFAIFNQKENNNRGVSEDLARCIGENSVYYSQTGCSKCRIQEDLFGENIQYINKIDCRQDLQKCIDAGIEATPTWIINGQKYKGVQTIENLKTLIGC